MGDAFDPVRRFRLDHKRAALDHIGAIGALSRRKKSFALVDGIALAADRENAQRTPAQLRQHRHPLKECDVVVDAHSSPLSAASPLPVRGHGTNL